MGATRRVFHKLALAAVIVLALAGPGMVQAQDYPKGPITFIIPFGAGGSADLLGRFFAQQLSEQLGAPVVVENRPGAGANIGMGLVAKAPPDGQTILFANNNLATNQFLIKDMPFDARRDLAPVVLLGIVPNVLVVHPSVPAKSVAEFVSLAKAKPGQLNYASPGNGTSVHLATELFRRVTATDIVHVPYRTSAQGMTDLVGGRVEMIFETASSAIPRIRENQIRALGVTATARLPELPDVPTFKELGYGDFVNGAWVGLLVPAGTPAAIVAKLNQAIAAKSATPAYRERLAQLGTQPLGGTPADFAKWIDDESARWGTVIREIGIKAE